MNRKQIEDLSVDELAELLYRKKRRVRRQRLQRLKEDGRVVDVAGVSPPNPIPPRLSRPQAAPSGAMRAVKLAVEGEEEKTAVSLPASKPGFGRRFVNHALLFVEIVAVVGLVIVLLGLWRTQSDLNQELAKAQQAEVQTIALPSPTAKPLIDVGILPTGHRFIEGALPIAEESGDIPEHLLPIINAYQSPPIPTPGPQQARRVQIPAIGVDSTIVEGVYDWEQLKKGVGHQIDSAQPGEPGNMVLAAHNDIYGEIFRHLDQLSPGDEIIVSTELQSYTYVVNNIEVVDPVDGVWVMAPTDHSSTTLISCYPYRINTDRIVVFADLVTDG